MNVPQSYIYIYACVCEYVYIHAAEGQLVHDPRSARPRGIVKVVPHPALSPQPRWPGSTHDRVSSPVQVGVGASSSSPPSRTVGRWTCHYGGEAERGRGVSKPGHERCGAVPSPGGRERSAAGLGEGAGIWGPVRLGQSDRLPVTSRLASHGPHSFLS